MTTTPIVVETKQTNKAAEIKIAMGLPFERTAI